MGISTRQPDQSPQHHEPTVFIGTLGGVWAMVRGAAASWKVGNMGVPQLKRMVSYLVAHVDHAIHRDDLAAIGSTRWQLLARATNLPSSLKRLLHNWDMAPALHERDGYLTLMRHACWVSDTDLIEQYVAEAAIARSIGDNDAALSALQQAASYCGGPYLPDYDVPEYSLNHEQQRWLGYQHDVLHQLARHLFDRAAYKDALAAAKKIAHLGLGEPADNALFADIYAVLGITRMETHYRQKANYR